VYTYLVQQLIIVKALFDKLHMVYVIKYVSDIKLRTNKSIFTEKLFIIYILFDFHISCNQYLNTKYVT